MLEGKGHPGFCYPGRGCNLDVQGDSRHILEGDL